MTKKDLKQLIKECYEEVVKEQEELGATAPSVEPSEPHSETEPTESEDREVQIARQLKTLADELLTMHGASDEEEAPEGEEAESEVPAAGEESESAPVEMDEAKKKDKWISKAVDPKHKGYCSPMTKKTCTPRRKALAMRFKKGISKK